MADFKFAVDMPTVTAELKLDKYKLLWPKYTSYTVKTDGTKYPPWVVKACGTKYPWVVKADGTKSLLHTQSVGRVTRIGQQLNLFDPFNTPTVKGRSRK